VKKHGGNQPVPLMADKDTGPKTGAESIENLPVHSPQNSKATAASRLQRSHQFDGEQNNVYDDDAGGHGSSAAKNSGQTLTHRRQRETQIRPALVTPSRMNADECPAGRAQLRPPLSAPKHPAEQALPAFEPHLPLVGKCQHPLLAHVFSRFYNTGNAPCIPARGVYGQI